MSQRGEEAGPPLRGAGWGMGRGGAELVLGWRGERGATLILALTPCPSTQEVPTLGQLWAREQQVLVSYEDEATVSRHDELWPAIPYWWGNAVKTDALLQFLETKKGHGRPGDVT